jgi:hypothetical protein
MRLNPCGCILERNNLPPLSLSLCYRGRCNAAVPVRIKPKFIGTRNFIGFMTHNLQLGHVHEGAKYCRRTVRMVGAVHSCTDIEICAPELGTPSHTYNLHTRIQSARKVFSRQICVIYLITFNMNICIIFYNSKQSNRYLVSNLQLNNTDAIRSHGSS